MYVFALVVLTLLSGVYQAEVTYYDSLEECRVSAILENFVEREGELVFVGCQLAFEV